VSPEILYRYRQLGPHRRHVAVAHDRTPRRPNLAQRSEQPTVDTDVHLAGIAQLTLDEFGDTRTIPPPLPI
jgi:hypothetical protein